MGIYASTIFKGVSYSIELKNAVEKPYSIVRESIENERGDAYQTFIDSVNSAGEVKKKFNELSTDELRIANAEYLKKVRQQFIADAAHRKEPGMTIDSNQATAFGIIAGIITSIVTAVFAITKPVDPNPGSNFAARAFKQNGETYRSKPWHSREKLTSFLTNSYIFLWFVFGGMSFLFGFYNIADDVPRIELIYEHGRLWFGLATGAIISLLAIDA